MATIKILEPAPRITVYEDLSHPTLGLSFRAPTEPPDFDPPENISPASDEIEAIAFVDGAIEQNLSEAIIALSGIDESDFCKFTTMQFTFESDLFHPEGPKRANCSMPRKPSASGISRRGAETQRRAEERRGRPGKSQPILIDWQ